MAKMTVTVIGAGLILIIMGLMSGMPGSAAGVIIFWVLYFGCMLIKGASSDNSASANKQGVVILKCPKCDRTTVIEEDEIKKCKYCNQIIE